MINTLSDIFWSTYGVSGFHHGTLLSCMTDYTQCATVLYVIRISGVNPCSPSVAWTKCANANFELRDFPQQSVENERKRKRERQSEREKSNSKNGRRARTSGTSGTQPSLIIELNVANADFDESSGFECPLRYVTVTLASQLTN